jgi:NADH-quinone oxidoreductase subunit G
VRYSQEVAEDYQLVLLERGAHSFVGTFDGHPYVAPFSGNIIELCPVGALTSRAYRFRARPWDIESGGTICTMCPAQCNVSLTVRDERVMRVLARDHDEVDDGWLCDKGRFAYQHVHADERIVTPLVREGLDLVPASWDKALAAAGSALAKAGERTAALAGGETSNEEAFLLASMLRDGLGSPHLAAQDGAAPPADVMRALADPALQATVPDLEFAHAVLLLGVDPIDDAPVWDLRIRKGVRRHGVKLAVAGARPSALDPSATAILRHAPGAGEALLVALDAALTGDEGNLGGAATAAGTNAQSVRDLVEFLQGAGEDLVIVYGEGALSAQGARALLNVAGRLGLSGRAGAGLLGIPASTNGRGIREAGFAPDHGPGYAALDGPGRDARGIAEALAQGELSTVWLHHVDPLRAYADRALWDAALGTAQSVIAVDTVLTDTIRAHADVVFPAEAYAEKEGTVTHPDGRVQRLRPVIGRPRSRSRDGDSAPGVHAVWQVIADVSRAAGLDVHVVSGAAASRQLFDAVPFYAGLTLDEIGGRGVRWPETEAGTAWGAPAWEPASLEVPAAASTPNGRLRLGTFRTLWASKEVDASPALAFLRARQVVELSPQDAGRLGIGEGDRVEVAAGDARVQGPVRIRAAIPDGSVFVAAGTQEEPANRLTEPLAEVRRVGSANGHEPSAIAAQVQPAAEGLAEAPASAPLPIPPTSEGTGGSEG